MVVAMAAEGAVVLMMVVALVIRLVMVMATAIMQ
jgi:hypothetical protein